MIMGTSMTSLSTPSLFMLFFDHIIHLYFFIDQIANQGFSHPDIFGIFIIYIETIFVHVFLIVSDLRVINSFNIFGIDFPFIDVIASSSVHPLLTNIDIRVF